MPTYLFVGGTTIMMTSYGGLFSVLPAYINDLFGTKHVGAIHGKALVAWYIRTPPPLQPRV